MMTQLSALPRKRLITQRAVLSVTIFKGPNVVIVVGTHSARLHHLVRRLTSPSEEGAVRAVYQPEALWAKLDTTVRCQDVWWRDPRCAEAGT